MIVYVVGNPLVTADQLPVMLLPALKRAFPMVSFIHADPNENFIPEEGSVIIDTVEGVRSVQRFEDINRFVTTRSVSPHDYDLGFHLKLLFKLKKISHVIILGVPVNGSRTRVLDQLVLHIRQLMDK